MPTKPPLRSQLSWPERQLLWIERDRSFARWLHAATARRWVVPALGVVSRVGDGWIWYAVIVALPWLDHAEGTSCALRMVAVGGVNLAIYKIVKHWIARPRPCCDCPGIRACARPLDEFSFPSGHTLHSVAFALILAAYDPAWAIVVWPCTLLVAASRVILGLHYPSDVLVGAAIGALTAALSFNLL